MAAFGKRFRRRRQAGFADRPGGHCGASEADRVKIGRTNALKLFRLPP